MKGWLDNFGKADNANESNVSLPEGFVGLGYDTKGRNYSSAWGGQFEQGGIIPIAQNGVSEYMEKKKWEEKDKNISQKYDLPEVVVSAPYLTKYNDPNKLTGYPQYVPKPGDNVNSPGWDIAEFYKSWVSSPEYERRMKNTGYYERPPGGDSIYGKGHPLVRLSSNQYLENARNSRMGALEATQEPGFVKTEPAYYKGRRASLYTPYGISIDPLQAETPEMYKNVLAHEIGHAIDSSSDPERQLIYDTMLTGDAFDQPQFYIGRNPVTGNLISDEKSRIRRSQAIHVRDPDEFKSDLNALRYFMFDKGIYDIRKGKEFTKEDLEKAKEVLKDNPSLERSLDAAGESGFIKLMNVIAKSKEDVTPIAMNGASMPGSVGFTYARVAGAAPSKGKYAKKTMASAQIGKNVKKDATNIDTGVANKIAGLELQQNPDYQYFKYLQSLPQLRQAPGRGEELMRKGLGYADVATDVMQMGNFIPHPTAQAVGKVGNIAGMIVDGLQGADEAYRGNYLNAGINLASVALPMFLGSNTFRRNAMNLRPGDPLYSLTQKAGKPYTIDLNKTDTGYLELFSKVKGMKDKSLMYNRAFLGGLGAETAYDAGLIGPVKKEYGGEIPSAQNGQEMRFYQNGLDWKPKSMQPGGDIERVSVNDPRYPELYKNRQVGAYYDGAYSLPDLDEVTVTAPRSYTMDSLRNFTTAALYGAPANAMKLSMIPQAAMTEGIEALRGKPYDFSNVNPNFGGFTSNQRDLSQTMGYENPEGFLQNAANFGLSMVDPLALVGAGGARNLVKPSKSVFTKLLKAYDPRNLKTQSGLDWSKRWYDNPEIVQRKKAMAYGDFDDDAINNAAEFNSKAYVEYAKESLNQYKPKSYIDLLKDKGLNEYLNYGPTTGGLSYGRPDQIYVNRPMYLPFDKKGLESVRVHELSHLVNRNGSGFTRPEESTLLKPFGFEDDIVRLNKLKEIESKSKKKWASYYTEPTEIKARMDQARFDLNLSPKDKFTPEMFDKILKDNNFYGMGKYIKDKDTFVDLMNKFWAVPAVGVAVGAQAADQQKNGGSVKDNKNPMQRFQEGGKIYEGQELPEFVVEGKDERIKNAMSQGMAKFYGHVGELMGAPQKEMMQLITGKEQTPSEAFGFQNTGGWLDSPTSFGKNLSNFTMDALGDPLNAVGVGLADDIFKLGVKNVGKNLTENLGKGIGKRAISQAPSPQMMVDDVSAQLTNNSNQLGNTATQVPNSDPFRYQQRWQEKKDEILKHIETQEGRKRLRGLIDKNYLARYNNLTVDEFIEKFKQTKFEVEKPREIYRTDQNGNILRDVNGWAIKDFERNPDGTVKLYPNSPIDAYHWPREGLDNPSFMYAGRELTPYDVNHTLEHEFGHFFQYGRALDEIEQGVGSLADIKLKDKMGSDNFRDVINKFNPFYKKTSDLGESETRRIFGFTNPSFGFDEAKRYWNIGSGSGREKYPFAAEIRENLLQSGILKNRYDEITPEMLKKHKRLYERRTDDRYYLRLYEIMEDTKDNFKILSNALNKIPAVALPAAGGAAALTSGLQDEQPVQKQKNGGITKDNLGYWNPDNWGQPVEIGSNNITMEGVYEPLLGVSDTGDTKLMKPGKNYKFKGKKVTEFPVAKLGINQLDAQPMKKLNQLLNFTNNPDKDNWLDKYN